MSCHHVGRALNNVVKEIWTLYDEGEIDARTAKRLIGKCAESVDWCDGNVDEAIHYVDGCVCGRCFKVIPQGKPLYYFWAVSDSVSRHEPMRDENGDKIVPFRLCSECFDIVLNHRCNDKDAGRRESAYIRENYSEGAYTSTGEYPSTNSGIP